MEGPELVALALVVVGLYLALVLVLIAAGRRVLARELAALVPNLARLFAGLVRDPRVPLRAKLALGFGGAYLAMPIDIVPDFIPVVGSLDDAIVAALVLRYVLRSTDPEVARAHWRGDPATFDRLLRLAGRR